MESIRRGNKLSRIEIAKECGFAKSVLLQNPSIKSALKKLENDLFAVGILGEIINQFIEKPKLSVVEDAKNWRIKKRLNDVEQQNQTLHAENVMLKLKLKQCNILEEYLIETGRVPR